MKLPQYKIDMTKYGYAKVVSPEILNQAARIRSLTSAEDETAVESALSFIKAHSPDAWSLMLPQVWQAALASGAESTIRHLGEAMKQRHSCMSGLDAASAELLGMPLDLFEQLLDASAHVTVFKRHWRSHL